MTDATRRRLTDLTFVDVDDLDTALDAVEEIQAVAQADRHLVIEACALVHAAWTHLLRGDFPSAEFCLDRAEDAFAEVGDDGLWERALVPACRGALEAWRGSDGAGRHFDLAAEVTATATPAGVRVAAALRADTLANPIPPPDRPSGSGRPGVAPGSAAAAATGSGGNATKGAVDVAWAIVWARRGLALAALAAGELDEAAHHIDALLAADDVDSPPLNAIERGRSLVVQGEVQLRRGDPRAVITLREAADLLEPRVARYPATRALLLLAEADPEAAADALRRARTLSSADSAFRRLWELRPMLHIEVLGGQAVRLGDDALALSKNAAQLVHLLAFAGPYGRHWEAVADRIWPHVVDNAKAASNVTSLTRNTRARLGAEAWRLRREGSMLFFDLDYAGLDLADAVATAEWCLGTEPPRAPDRLARALELLRRPVLPMWADSPWVREIDAWRADRLDSLVALLSGRDEWAQPADLGGR